MRRLALCTFVVTSACSARGDAGDAGKTQGALEAHRSFSALVSTSAPARPAGARRLPTPIVPAEGGRFVQRRFDGGAFFTDRGFALSIGAPGGRYGVRAELGSGRRVAPRPERPERAAVNRYLGARAEQALPTYGAVAWDEAAPGVHMWAEPADAGFSYSFVVAPGAELSGVSLDWSGVREVRAEGDRSLRLETGGPTVRIAGLRAFVLRGSQREELPARFTWERREDALRVGVVVEGWRGDAPLLVDPTVSWSSYLGGGDAEQAPAIAADASGNVLVAGSLLSTDFPATTGLDTSLAGGRDAFVAKLGPSGSLIWATYLGGATDDEPLAVAADTGGNVWVAGRTQSTDFPTSGAFDTTPTGWEGFVTRLSPSGTLAFSTYLGGSQADYAYGLALDSAGNALVVLDTTSPDLPASTGLDVTYSGTNDAFVAKISSAGALTWGTYLGGSSWTVGRAVAVDASGDLFVAGETGSTDLPKLGGFDATFNAKSDGFVTRLTGAGVPVWTTYLGGGGDDGALRLAATKAGDVVVAGYTGSSDFPSAGGFDKTLGGTRDAFVTRLTGSGALAWSTYVGGSAVELVAVGLATDPTGAVYVSGATPSGDFPPGLAAAGGRDAFVLRLAADGAFAWSTLLGGSGLDGASDVTVDPAGGVVVTGTTSSSDFPAKAPLDVTLGGSADAFVVRLPAPAALGTSCAADNECSSGHCADGVCCDTSCAGACLACKAAKKGSGVDGTCGPVAAGTDPNDGCVVGAGTCAADGFCDGAGKCRSFARAGTPCGATTCAGGAATGKVCRGDSAECIDDKIPCAPYVCGAAACRDKCAGDADCDPTAYCSAVGACVVKSAKGEPCAEARACDTGFCVDGVCCDTKCDGQCESCSESTPKGTCTPTKGAPRGGRKACEGDGACAGACDGVNTGACSRPVGFECSASCKDDKQAIGRCDASGACVTAAPEGCNGFACDGAQRCRTACATTSECASKFVCDAGKCRPAPAPRCADDGTSVIGADGRAQSCGVYLCKDGACLERCERSEQCAPGLLCDGAQCVRAAPAEPASDGGCTVGRAPDASWASWMGALALAGWLARRRRGSIVGGRA